VTHPRSSVLSARSVKTGLSVLYNPFTFGIFSRQISAGKDRAKVIEGIP
jgi:hypothetical protein